MNSIAFYHNIQDIIFAFKKNKAYHNNVWLISVPTGAFLRRSMSRLGLHGVSHEGVITGRDVFGLSSYAGSLRVLSATLIPKAWPSRNEDQLIYSTYV